MWKNYHKNEQHSRLVTYIFTKLSQNMRLINTHILIYQHVMCHCKLWNASWFYCVFFGVLLIIDVFSCLNHYICTKLSQNLCLINIHILIYWHARYDCRLWNVYSFYCIFWEFYTQLTTIHVWIVVSPPNFHKLCVQSIDTFKKGQN